MRGGIQEYLWPSNPPIFWVESWKKLCQSLTRCLKVVPMILSLYHGSTIDIKSTFDAVLPLETSHPFCVPLICDQCSYFDHRHPFFPIKILYHTHLIYIAGKSWIIVISSLLPLQSDFLWFLIIFRALQNCDFLKLWMFSTLFLLLGIKPSNFCLITNLNLLPCQTLMWSVILSISSYVTYGIRHMTCRILPLTSFVHHLWISQLMCQMSKAD